MIACYMNQSTAAAEYVTESTAVLDRLLNQLTVWQTRVIDIMFVIFDLIHLP